MKLVWSRLAADDLAQLRRFSVPRWGGEITAQYLADLRTAARRVAARPDRARAFRGSLRIIRVRSHYLIVEADVATDRLIVARVLHTAMDLERHLSSC